MISANLDGIFPVIPPKSSRKYESMTYDALNGLTKNLLVKICTLN